MTNPIKNNIMPPKEWYENDPEAKERWENYYAVVMLDHTQANPEVRSMHRLRVIKYVPNGAVYLIVEEHHPGYSGERFVELTTAIHALLNLGDLEIFQVGNREQDFKGTSTPTPPEY